MTGQFQPYVKAEGLTAPQQLSQQTAAASLQDAFSMNHDDLKSSTASCKRVSCKCIPAAPHIEGTDFTSATESICDAQLPASKRARLDNAVPLQVRCTQVLGQRQMHAVDS